MRSYKAGKPAIQRPKTWPPCWTGKSCPTPQDVAAVLDGQIMLLPAVEAGSGPFQGQKARWHGAEPPLGSGQRTAALSFYLALMTGTCLDLIAGAGPTIVEGPFARNAHYIAMLHAVTQRPVMTSAAATGTSIGAALLLGDDAYALTLEQAETALPSQALRAYADLWFGLAGDAYSDPSHPPKNPSTPPLRHKRIAVCSAALEHSVSTGLPEWRRTPERLTPPIKFPNPAATTGVRTTHWLRRTRTNVTTVVS